MGKVFFSFFSFSFAFFAKDVHHFIFHSQKRIRIIEGKQKKNGQKQKHCVTKHIILNGNHNAGNQAKIFVFHSIVIFNVKKNIYKLSVHRSIRNTMGKKAFGERERVRERRLSVCSAIRMKAITK